MSVLNLKLIPFLVNGAVLVIGLLGKANLQVWACLPPQNSKVRFYVTFFILMVVF